MSEFSCLVFILLTLSAGCVCCRTLKWRNKRHSISVRRLNHRREKHILTPSSSIQDNVQGAKAFNHNVMSFSEKHYVSLVHEMNLPLQVAESSSVVGPFFWWALCRAPADHEKEFLQIVFRKSDVRWKGTSRGWEMALSYSFQTKLTCGYIRGTKSAGIAEILELLSECAKQALHPLLLPLLMLEAGLAPTTENNQRKIRDRLRDLESAMGGERYNMAPAEGYGPETDIRLDEINRELADLQCKVMWKRPQVWKGAVGRLNDATERFWEKLPDEDRKVQGLEDVQATIKRRLDFASVRLDGLESYIQVSLERLNIQRETVSRRSTLPAGLITHLTDYWHR